jgi:hypothetical protein
MLNKMFIIGILILFATIVPALSIEGTSTMDLCQCETEAQVFSVCASTSGNYNISLLGEVSKWVRVAPENIFINANTCEDVFVFVTPECYANSGTYSFQLNVDGPEQASKNVSLLVEQCHTFNYNVTPLTNTSNPCEQNVYDVSIKNTSDFVSEFVLLQQGLNDSWVTYPRTSFVLAQNESLNTQLVVESDCSTLSSSYPFSLTVSNIKTNASSTKNLVQEINSFNPIEHNISQNISVCSETGNVYDLTITNVSSKQDTIVIDVNAPNFVSVSTNTLVLDPQESKTIMLSVSETLPQSTNFNLSLYSQNYDYSISRTVNLEVKDCYNVSIARLSEQENYCLGNNSQSFLVSNQGTEDIEVLVSLNGLDVNSKTIQIPSDLSKEVSFNFNEQEGSKNVLVSAETTHSRDEIEYTLNFENCYGADIVIPNVSVCAIEQKTIFATIKNNGTKSQAFSINTNADWIVPAVNEITVESNSEQQISFNLTVPEQLDNNYSITLKSNNVEITRIIPMQLLSEENCYAFDVQKTHAVIDVNCCDGELTEIILKNTGNFSQTFNIEKIAPEWVSFSHKEATLSPGEEQKMYIYFSPPAGTNGQLISTIKITNQRNISKEYDFNLNVFGGNCGIGLAADLDVDGQTVLTKIFTRKEIDVEFSIVNDSNVGFNIIDVKVQEYPNSDVTFTENVFLSPQESTKAWITISFLENQEPEDRELTLNIMTSVGEFQKKQLVKFSDANEGLVYDEVAITGFFTQFVAPVAGILLLIIILAIIVVFASHKNKENKIKKRKKKK